MNFIENWELFSENRDFKDIKVRPYYFINDIVTEPKRLNYSIHPDLVKDILTWDEIHCSPTSNSFYNMAKTWNYTPDGIIRVSDHWNFYVDEYFDKRKNKWVESNVLHCRTDKDVPDSNWTIARYDRDKQLYRVIKSYPKGSFVKELNQIRNEIFSQKKQSSIDLKKKSYAKLVTLINLNKVEIKVDGTYHKIKFFNETNRVLKFDNVSDDVAKQVAKDFFDDKIKCKLDYYSKIQYFTWTELCKFLYKEVSS